ncbi:hypothetical protein BIU82_00925 [Arthrobacter sp. SW1]|uniref:glycosyltransferase n=1 Tax=Arthrobacter sp. SW1 TaxID=1920889 RepID=UPI000877B16D|nr:glycosyltransferase [Arthrobacter sp. SW1]OFI39658.1 hypothetical protein BIU82_00925 [Arthrobacter sp. SW1]
MKLHFSGFKPEEGSPLNEGIAALRYAASLGGPEPILFGYTPVARMNPYQGLLYTSFWEEGFAPSPITRTLDFDKLIALKDSAAAVAVHLHWHSTVLAGAADKREARTRLAGFKEQLGTFKDNGGKLVWTVHNVLPHDALFIDEEIELQNAIAESSDVIHTMSHRTIEAVSSVVALDPGRVLVAPHPSYLGAYEDYIGRHEARTTLGLHSDDVVYVTLGALKPYKGLREFLAGFNEFIADAGPRHKLIIAGEPDGSAYVAELVDDCRRHPQVLLDDRKIPPGLVQYYMRAADFAVVPYLRSLNSGAALLGTTFGLPVISSRQGSLPEVLDPSFAEFLPGESPGEIAGSLALAQRLLTPAASAAARGFAEGLAPASVSTAFARSLRERLLEPPSPPTGTSSEHESAGLSS